MKKEIKKKTDQPDKAPQSHIGQNEMDEVQEYLKSTARSAIEIPDRLQDYVVSLTKDSSRPTLTGTVLNTLKTLADVGVWEKAEKGNSTTYMAVKALDAYTKMLQRLSQYRSAKKAADKAYDEWLAGEKLLAENLVFKGLEPLKGTDGDPLNWYRPTSVLLKTYKSNTGKPLSQRVLNKYQAAGLIPPPIRIGRQTYRSFLTLIFLNTIEWVKQHGTKGIKLSDPKMKEEVNSLVSGYLALIPDDKDADSPLIKAMLDMINEHREALAKNWYDILLSNKGKMANETRGKGGKQK